jgi:hypothetical protein
MSVENNIGYDISLNAAADLSAKQFQAVVVDSNGKAALAGAGAQAIGILQNKPTSGQAAAVRVLGISKMLCGGSFNAGDLVSCDSNGKAVKYTAASVSAGTPEPLAGTHVLGVALEAGVNAQYAAVALIHSGLSN